MKIVIDFRKYDGVVGGVERFVIEIVKYIAQKGHKVILLPKLSRLVEVEKKFENLKNIKLIPLAVKTHTMSINNLFIDSYVIPNIIEKERADLVHFPYNWAFPFKKVVPSVLTLHDVIPFTFPEGMGKLKYKLFYKPGVRVSCLLNDVIVTASEFSKKDIVKKVGISKTKIKVIPNGISQFKKVNKKTKNKVRKELGVADKFILNVGGIHEPKNVVRLVCAFSELVKGTGYGGMLVITGSVSSSSYKNKMKKYCDDAAKKTNMGKRIIFTGFIKDEELNALLQDAQMLVYPSLYEGFGMPIIEAMNTETPVIASNITSMPEVAGDAALLVNPYSAEEISLAMSRLLSDSKLGKQLILKGKKRAKQYSWKKTAEKYIALYQSL